VQAAPHILQKHARAIWQAGVDAVAPSRLIAEAVSVRRGLIQIGPLRLPLGSVGRMVVVGAGKAGAAMSRAIEDVLGPEFMNRVQLQGCVNVPDRAVVPLGRIHLHPSRSAPDSKPTAAGVEGSRRIRELVSALGPNDLALCLISGGGSALMPAPVSGVSLADKQAVTSLLHSSGATIGEMNAVRKHLSELKGGGLVRAFRGRRLVSLIISDVVGDPLDVIASGPTAADQSTFADALAVLDRYGLADRVPAGVRTYLSDGAAGKHPETLKRLPRHVTNCVIGNNATALAAAERVARRLGYRVLNLSSFIEGDSGEVGRVLAGMARGVRDADKPLEPPVCILSGGETTVRLGDDHGLGGRNQELVLAAAHHLDAIGLERIVILSGGTDGEDGPTDAAGAIADSALMRKARTRGIDPARHLNRHDSYHFFDAVGGLIKTGLTDTNVMDLRVVLVGPPTDR
jgi:hydroxypyruvate reductase/glycerate 2-kinase